MMLYPSMNELLKKIPNRYSLVNVAAKRARDIAEAAEMDPEIHLTEKPVSLALADIINDKIKPVACVEADEDEAVLEENAAEEAVTLAE
ncbi:MAG: DNA-directed RNA polymerase subunit omega [Clostridia bacterium]|nr:DNA-directed RNA polymerase subunit omega [Clostridia bacterium]